MNLWVQTAARLSEHTRFDNGRYIRCEKLVFHKEGSSIIGNELNEGVFLMNIINVDTGELVREESQCKLPNEMKEPLLREMKLAQIREENK